MRTRVKICGITRYQDAIAALEAGADALGFVFYPPSPRYIAPEAAADIIHRLPAFVTTTGLFVDAEASQVDQILSQTRIDLLQFHGNEEPAYCNAFTRPYIKAIRMKPDVDLRVEMARYDGARGILLDAYRAGVPGGTGEVFDWQAIPADLAPRIILAGGLNSDNVARAVAFVKPYAVDVSGGVEQDKGIKHAGKIKQFIDEVIRANSN